MLIYPGSSGGKLLRFPRGSAPSAPSNPFIDGTATGGVFYWDSTLQTGYVNDDPVGVLANYLPGGTITLSQTGTARPLWKTNIGPNGRPALRFDGVNDQMLFSAEPLPTGNNAASVYCYVSFAGNYTRAYNIGGSGGSFDNSHSLGISDAFLAHGLNPEANPAATSPLNKRYASANRYTPGTRTARIRGAENLTATGSGTNTLTSGSSALGAYANSAFLNGDIMGFAIYTGNHSDTVADQLLAYWVALFG